MGSSLAWLPSFCMRSSGIERPAIARVSCPERIQSGPVGGALAKPGTQGSTVVMGNRERNKGITRKIIRGAAESSHKGDLWAMSSRLRASLLRFGKIIGLGVPTK